jgi:membrane fusion protein, heavy metal efflux system
MLVFGENTTMASTKKQGIAIAVIVLAGILGGGAVLWSDRPKPGGEASEHAAAGSEHEHEHEHEHEQGDDPGKQAKAPAQAAANEAHEERALKLTDRQRETAGVALQTAGAAKLRLAARFPGEVRFDEERTAHVVPRMAGVAEAVPAHLGERVRKGQVLAVIASPSLSEQRSELLTAKRRRDAARTTFEREKKLWLEKISAEQDYLQAQTALQEADIAVQNASQKLAALGATEVSTGLNRFDLRAPFAGTIVEKHLSLGESVAENASIFTVSDLSSVWVEFAVAPKDLATVRLGQKVIVSSTAFDSEAEGTISYIGALLGEQTRTARGRVSLTNPQGAWRPGLFVTVAVLGEDQAVPLAVPADAVQTIDEQPMVFVAVPGGFVARPVELGRSDGKTVEVLGGVRPGEKVASTNTFVLKSELGKAGAEHGH